jgi:plastocyanin
MSFKIAFSAAALIATFAGSPALAEDKTLIIKDYMFVPVDLTLSVGSKVTWTNHDDVPHTIAEKNKLFRSAALDEGDSYSFVFTKPGTYTYYCTLHPQMVGKIVVTAAPKR